MEALRRRKEEVVRRHGAWTSSNIHLGDGVYTIGPDSSAMNEARVLRVTQAVLDLVGGDLTGLRVLDLGCYEGAFAIELALRGAELVAVDAREEHVARALFAKEELGLERLTVEQVDVRDLSAERFGGFDLVLCLGILYHLDLPAAFQLVEAVADVTRRAAVVETQVSLSASERVEFRGRAYHGRWYREPPAPGSSVGNPRSFWFTKASLLNLLSDAGFSSVSECLNPVIPDLAAYRDHTTLIAIKGAPVELESVPQVPGSTPRDRWPEQLPPVAHPAQGGRWWLLDRVRRRRGGGLPAVFRK